MKIPIILQSHIVPEGAGKARLSDYAIQVFTLIPSRKGIKKAIQRGEILVDGEPAETGRWVQPGMQLDWVKKDSKASKHFELKLEVTYEDEQMAVVIKPAGLVVSGNQFRTLENALAFNLNPAGSVDALNHPIPVHRLDAPTSGLVLVSKTRHAQVALSRQFQEQKIEKHYCAVAIGQLSEQGFFDADVDGKTAYTTYDTEGFVPSLTNEYLSLVHLYPKTGRTHQLRRHLADAGHPIMGDKLYGSTAHILKKKGLFLSAIGLKFQHPKTGEPVDINIPIPNKFQTLMDREERRWKKFKTSF